MRKTISQFFFITALAVALIACPVQTSFGQGFRLDRVADGLDSPTSVTHVPGDDSSVYITELGGAIKKLDLASGTITPFATLDAATDWTGGLHALAFHPDYSTNGKFYVTRSLDPYGSFTRFVNRLDEFVVNGAGDVTHSNTLLEVQHAGSSNASHAIDWLGFDPTQPESDTLYVTIGDGYINNTRPDSSPYGKVLTFDTADPNTTWTLHHRGLRNPWKASFDRQTGDMYIGDVGFRGFEEINFAKAGSQGIDFGWALREGTGPGPANGPQGDTFNPIHQLARPDAFSIVGGYVYRGPVSELQGQYFYADTVKQQVWSAEYDRDTDPNDFNGQNFTSIVDRTGELNADITSGELMRNIVSFGEDNSGNLFIVDLGDNFEATPGSGQVFMIRAVPEPSVVALVFFAGSVLCVRRTGREH